MYQSVDTRPIRRWMAFYVALFLVLHGTGAKGADWEIEKVTDDGIYVYSRKTAGTTVREVKARMSIDAPAEMVFEAVQDPATFKKTMRKYVEKNLYFRTDNPNIWYNYQLINPPVIAKRDYCLKYEKITNRPNGVYIIRWRGSDQYGPSPQDDIVRVSPIMGSFEITENKGGKSTTIRYTLLADPGGSIPAWLINFANRRSLPNILRQVRDASLERRRTKR